MPETAPDFRLRAVITEGENGYIASISKASSRNEITILCEEEVADINSSNELVSRIALEQFYPSKDVDTFYNIGGRISSKPPKGRK